MGQSGSRSHVFFAEATKMLDNAVVADDADALYDYLHDTTTFSVADLNDCHLIHQAALLGHTACVRVLLEFGVDGSQPHEQHGLTPLHFAAVAEERSALCISELLRYNAPLHSLGGAQCARTPLHVAIADGGEEAVGALLAAGSCVNQVSECEWGISPLLLAIQTCPEPRVLQRLLTAGADMRKCWIWKAAAAVPLDVLTYNMSASCTDTQEDDPPHVTSATYRASSLNPVPSGGGTLRQTLEAYVEGLPRHKPEHRMRPLVAEIGLSPRLPVKRQRHVADTQCGFLTPQLERRHGNQVKSSAHLTTLPHHGTHAVTAHSSPRPSPVPHHPREAPGTAQPPGTTPPPGTSPPPGTAPGSPPRHRSVLRLNSASPRHGITTHSPRHRPHRRAHSESPCRAGVGRGGPRWGGSGAVAQPVGTPPPPPSPPPRPRQWSAAMYRAQIDMFYLLLQADCNLCMTLCLMPQGQVTKVGAVRTFNALHSVLRRLAPVHRAEAKAFVRVLVANGYRPRGDTRQYLREFDPYLLQEVEAYIRQPPRLTDLSARQVRKRLRLNVLHGVGRLEKVDDRLKDVILMKHILFPQNLILI